MAFSRRRFVQTRRASARRRVTGAWIGARGREDSVWSAFEPIARSRRRRASICLSSNENPLGPGKTVMNAVRAAFGTAGAAPGRYSGSSGALIDAIAKKHGVKPENIVARLRLDADPAHRARISSRPGTRRSSAPSRPTRNAPATPR